jgi:hemerythrin-like domain-containing protein
MRPTDILKEEHELILEMLKVMEAACARIDRKEKPDPGKLNLIVDFIRNFADRCHHAKEEKILFPALEKAGIAREGGPIGVMLHEHELGRGYVTGMNGAIQKMSADNTAAMRLFTDNAHRYVELLRSHIDRENKVLFAMAEEKIDAAGEKSIMEGFERVELEESGEGVHEMYHELLHELRDDFLA